MYSRPIIRRQAFLYTIIALSLTSCELFQDHQPLPDVLADQTITPKGENLPATELLKTDYLLLYFSAHWCPPCQAFTPKLVTFYSTHEGGTLFETLLISSDHSETEMMTYIKKAHMPWPALRFRSAGAKTLSTRYGGDGIPRLVLINLKGKVLADSYDGHTNLDPQIVLDELKKRLADPLSEQKKGHPQQAAPTTEKQTPLPLSEQIRKKYKLHGLGQGTTGNMAIINGEAKEIGDELESGVLILNINIDSVEILVKGQRHYLYPENL